MYGKIIDDEGLERALHVQRASGKTIVFTNGCFDILHPGHVSYLIEARSLGDYLIVGLNTDESVRKIKGPNRPINDLNDRATMLAALQCVDLIIPFADVTPLQLIVNIKPDIIVKGGDYKLEEMVGKSFVEAYEGQVKILPFKEGYSSSSILEKIKKL